MEGSQSHDPDIAFMEIVRNYPAIYDRSSKDFKDVSKKANCWKRVAEQCNEPVAKVKTRYNSIRTDFSRYLKKTKGKSGSGASDVEIDAKYEHLRWLKTFIVTRPSSGNFSCDNIESSGLSLSTTSKPMAITSTPRKSTAPSIISLAKKFLAQQNEEDSDESIGVDNVSLDAVEDSVDRGVLTSLHGAGVSQAVGGDEEKPNMNKSSSAVASVDLKADDVDQKVEKSSSRNWTKKESRKRKMEKTDQQLEFTMTDLAKSIREKENPALDFSDEDTLYCLSLATRLRKLDNSVSANDYFVFNRKL